MLWSKIKHGTYRTSRAYWICSTRGYYCKPTPEMVNCSKDIDVWIFTCREDFQAYDRSINQARAADDKKALQQIYQNIRKDYFQCRKVCSVHKLSQITLGK